MKSRLFLIIATLVGLGSMTTSCSWDDDLVVAPNDGDQKTPISFNVNIGSLPDPEVTTRGYSDPKAAGDYYFWANDVVAIGIQGVSGSVRDKNAEVVKKYNVEKGSATSTLDLTYLSESDDSSGYPFDWLGTSEVVSLRAWSYGNSSTPATAPEGRTFEIATNQEVDITDADGKRGSIKELLYGARANYQNASSINLPLYHQLSRIVVHVKNQLPSTTTIESVSIGNNNLPISATFSAPTGDTYNTWLYKSGYYVKVTTPTNTTDTRDKDETAKDANVYGSWKSYGAADQSITPKEWAAGDVPSGYDHSYSAVMLPNTYATNTDFIDIKLDGVTKHYIYKLGAATTFKPGRQYTFYITLLDEIRFTVSVAVSAWNTTDGATPTYNF